MGRGLPKPDMATRTFLLATMYQMAAERRASQEMYQNLQNMVYELAMRLDDNFTLSNEQKVRASCY
jgi:hypothetical protein